MQHTRFTDNDRCARLAKVNTSNFPSRLLKKRSNKKQQVSIYLPHKKIYFNPQGCLILEPNMLFKLQSRFNLTMTSYGYLLIISLYKLIWNMKCYIEWYALKQEQKRRNQNQNYIKDQWIYNHIQVSGKFFREPFSWY